MHVRASKASRVVSYGGGALCVGMGLLGLFAEFADRRTSKDIVFGYVLAFLFLAFGSGLISATYSSYAGGIWFPVGMLLVSVGIGGSAIEMDDWLRKTQHRAMLGLLLATLFFGVGGLFLLLGHRRHRSRRLILTHENV